MSGMSQNSQRFVLITGSSTGIGRAAAVWLSRQGYSIFGGVRNQADARTLESLSCSPGRIEALILDVTDAASIAAAAGHVREVVGSAGLMGLVNNAGVGVFGPVEFVTIEQWRQQFEVNVLGVIAVTQAMLPLLRVAADAMDAARIVLIGSIAGRVSQPIVAPYSASKHAIEALADALRIELRDQGIQTSLIEPGAIKTEIWRKGQESGAKVAADSPARQWYGAMIDTVAARAAESANGAIDADVVARAIQRCLEKPKAPTRVLVGRDAKLGALVRAILPDRWFDFVLARAFGIR
jgi:NAD(P)-dependent dehydrogenase (short-subunit alcohol dehydrogenase family)